MFYTIFIGSKSADSPSPKTSSNRCLKEIDSDWKAVVNTKLGGCKGASFSDNNVQIGARNSRSLGTVVGPYSEVDPNGEYTFFL